MAVADDTVVPLLESQVDEAAELAVRAFRSDPMMRYVFPDEDSRRRHGKWFLQRCIRYGLRCGLVHTTQDLAGVAAWIRPEHTPMRLVQVLRSGMLAAPCKLGWSAFRRFLTLTKAMENAHQQAASGRHWYLLLLVVDPSHQRRGVGTALLAPGLAQVDNDALPCYLETTTEGNTTYYRRHGFEVWAQQTVSPGVPSFWPMVREPRQPAFASGDGPEDNP